MHAIFSLTPTSWGDNYRFVELFETEKDAKFVLKALEKVNIDFNLYKIEKWNPKKHKEKR